MTEVFAVKFIRNFFTKGHERTLRAKKNIVISFICKGLSILISFLVVPLTLGYVGKVEYGIWLTISAIIQWFGFFDIGTNFHTIKHHVIERWLFTRPHSIINENPHFLFLFCAFSETGYFYKVYNPKEWYNLI